MELERLTENEFFFIRDAFSERFNSSDQNSILRARQAVAFINEYALVDILVSLVIIAFHIKLFCFYFYITDTSPLSLNNQTEKENLENSVSSAISRILVNFW